MRVAVFEIDFKPLILRDVFYKVGEKNPKIVCSDENCFYKEGLGMAAGIKRILSKLRGLQFSRRISTG